MCVTARASSNLMDRGIMSKVLIMFLLLTGCGRHTTFYTVDTPPPVESEPTPCDVVRDKDGMIEVICDGEVSSPIHWIEDSEPDIGIVVEPPACDRSRGRARDKNPHCR